MADVKTTYTSDVSRVEANNRKLERSNMRLIDQNRRLKAASRGAARGHSQAMSGMTSMAMGMLSSFVSVYAIIGKVRQAMQELEAFKTRAKTETMSLASAQESAILMLPVERDVREFEARINKIAEKGVAGGKKTLYQSAAGTMSAGGFEQGMQATEMGAVFGRHNAENLQAIATAAIDVSKITGETKDMMANIGWMIAATQTSRVESIAGMAKYAVPSVLAVTSTGGTPEEGMALFNAMTKGMADPQGRKAGTAAIGFAEGLRKFLPEKDLVEQIVDPTTGRIREVLRGKGTGLKSFAERLKYLREEPAKMEEFEAKYLQMMPKKSLGALRALVGLHPEEKMNQLVQGAYADTLKRQPTIAEAKPYAVTKRKQLTTLWPGQLATAGEISEATSEKLIGETATGREAAAGGLYTSADLKKKLQEAGVGFVKRQLDAWEYWTQGADRQAYENVMRVDIERMRGRRGQTQFAEPTPKDLESAQILEDHLKRLAETLERQEDQNERQIKAIEAQTAGALPANANAQLGIGGE